MDTGAAHLSPHASRHEPLPGRVGHVAGIESLTLDGRRHYFAFDHRSDLVVSPLIDTPDAMAAIAALPGNWGLLFTPVAEGLATRTP